MRTEGFIISKFDIHYIKIFLNSFEKLLVFNLKVNLICNKKIICITLTKSRKLISHYSWLRSSYKFKKL